MFIIQLVFLTLTGLVLADRASALSDYYNGYNTASQQAESSMSASEQVLGDFFKMIYRELAAESEQLKKDRNDQDEDAIEEAVNHLSSAIRNVGVGYNILKGSPDGDFDIGGTDRGILSTREIFKFTYKRGKEVFYMRQPMQVPDQVNFQPQESCSARNQISVYSGAKSYQNSLKFGASPGVTLYGFRFGLSAAVEKANRETAKRKRVNLDQKKICNFGRVEYLSDARGIHMLSRRFQDRVRQLPLQYDKTAYIQFLRDWGTHVIIRADIGTKQINRSSATYNQVYQQLKKQGSVGVTFGGSYSGFGGSLDLDIGALNIKTENSSKFGSRVTSFRIGSARSPYPISLKLMDISDALLPEYWRGLTGTSMSYRNLRIAEKRVNLARVLQDYADYEGVAELTDPQVRINMSWPNGMYALPAARSGCPRHWSSGQRSQASGENIDFSTSITRQMAVRIGNVITLGYCVKENEDMDQGIGFDWPEGRYCVARKGNFCPQPEFDQGSITWNDKKSITRQSDNSVWGKLPDGEYDKNTKIEFCCRSDGRPSDPILLPIKNPFVLYRYGGICQSVKGTTVKEHFVQFDDNSIAFSKNECTGAHPDDDDCKNRHRLHFCYYHRN